MSCEIHGRTCSGDHAIKVHPVVPSSTISEEIERAYRHFCTNELRAPTHLLMPENRMQEYADHVDRAQYWRRGFLGRKWCYVEIRYRGCLIIYSPHIPAITFARIPDAA